MNTAALWISARAADNSVEELIQALTIAGAMTLALGPTRKIETPSSRTLAINRRSQAAMIPGRNNGRVTVRSW